MAAKKVKTLTIQLRDAPLPKFSRQRKKRWKSIIEVFGYGYSDPYIVFLAEMLSILSGQEAKFSGSYSDRGYGTGEEYWSLKAGDLEIFRGKKSEIDDDWQRVETEDDRTIISGFPKGRSLQWDGEYNNSFGMKLVFKGVLPEEEEQLHKIADELFKDAIFSRS